MAQEATHSSRKSTRGTVLNLDDHRARLTNSALQEASANGAQVSLRRVVFDADFRKSEETLFNMFAKENPKIRLRDGECILFLSKTKHLMYFVFGRTTIANRNGGNAEILRTAKYRIKHGSFNPLMIADYAAEKGLELKGLKKFRDHYSQAVMMRAFDILNGK